MQLIGQTNNKIIIDAWKDLPNFIIIQGDEHMGKSYLVSYLCDKFKKDYVLVENKVSSVRELVDTMYEGSNVLYHFKNFDKSSLQAKNALLKVTEEMPEGNYIVITGGNQIETLKSRARLLSIEEYTEADMVKYLAQYYQGNLPINLYRVGVNSPSKCELYRVYEPLGDLYNYVKETYDSLSYLGIDKIIYMTSRFEKSYKDDLIDPCYLFIDMLINMIRYNVLERLNMKFAYFNVLNLLIECKEELIQNTTLNRKMLLYKTFYQIKLLGGEL